MHRTWMLTALLVPVLFAALPLAALFTGPSETTLEPDGVLITVTRDADSIAMRASGPEPQRDCSYESNLHIES